MSEHISFGEVSNTPQISQVGDPVAAKLDSLHTEIDKSSLVPEALAWDIAHAQKEFLDDYVANNRRMTLDQVFELGQLAGQAAETARRDYLGNAGPNTHSIEAERASEVAPTPISVYPIEIKPHYRTLIESVELGLEQLGEQAAYIITGLASSPVGKQYLQTEIIARNEPTGSRNKIDKLNLYDPESGTMTSIRQYTLEQTDQHPEIIDINIKDLYMPIEANGKAAGERLVTSGLRYSKGIYVPEKPYCLNDSFAEKIIETLHADDPALIANWVTRITRAVPVTDAEVKQLYKRVDVDHVPRQYRGKSRETRKVNYAENDSRKTRKLIETLKERRQQINTEDISI